jgi:hypothetical protein
MGRKSSTQHRFSAFTLNKENRRKYVAAIERCVLIPKPDCWTFKLWNFQIELAPSRPASKVEWSFKTDSANSYAVSRNQITGWDQHPKGELFAVAANGGVSLQKVFIQEIFRPIDNDLLQLQQTMDGLQNPTLKIVGANH